MHQLGAGVLGPVFRASAPETGQPVAIKAFHLDLTPELADELADALQQLVDARLAHPGIVTPLAVGCERSVPYLAQDYVAAESLDVAMRHYAPAAAERAVPLIYHLAGAVDAAHDAGVVHGSLHLRDVFVSPDEARATGFGIARALEHVGLRAPVRRPYAAPEVVAGGDWGPEADRYAVAAIAYELLTGRRATGSGDEIIERLGSVYVGDEGALPALRDVFSWGLSEEASGRPARAVELVTALAEALGVDAIEPEPVDAPAATADPLLAQPPEPVPVLRSGEDEPYDEPYDEPSAAVDEGVDADRPGPALLGEQADAGADGDREELPASLREDGEPAAPESLEDPDPLDDLEPIEDEEPLSLGGRVRAVLQATAAVVIGVLFAGVVYFLFGAEVGVGGGEAPVPDRGVALGEGTASRPAPGASAVRGPNAASLPPLAESVREPASDFPPPVPASPPTPVAEPQAADPLLALTDVPDAEAAREPAAAAPQVGWLLVRTSPPGSSVSVEGVDRGQTPLSLRDVPYGTHRVEIRAPGYEPQTRDVTVSAEATVAAVSVELAPGGEPQMASAQPPAPVEPTPVEPAPVLAPVVSDVGEGTVGSVFVESRPAGARVVIDGEPAGVTPAVLTDILPGRHEVRIEHDGYRAWITTVDVPAFDRIRVAASLDQSRP